jgi:hypothetical protein
VFLEHPSQPSLFETSVEWLGEQLVQLCESERVVRVFEQNTLGALDDRIYCSSW